MPETGRGGIRPSSACRSSGWARRLGRAGGAVEGRRAYSGDEVYALEVVAMVLAEMAELGAFTGEGAALRARHTARLFRGGCAQEGTAMGHVWLHEPRVVVTNPSPTTRRGAQRLNEAVERLRVDVDQMLTRVAEGDRRAARVLEAYRMFANSRGWMRRMEEDIARGLSAEAAVEKEQSAARARMERCPTPTCATGCTTSTICRTGCCAS
jgi:phosphotransferase system enzyme I (PtsP)